MKAKIEKGVLTIDVAELVDSLSAEDLKELRRHLIMDKDLFAAILRCVADESRLGTVFDDDPEGDWWFGGQALLEFREKLLPLMNGIARGAVEETLAQRNAAKAEAEAYRRWAFAMYHAWPDRSPMPKGPPNWAPSPRPSDAEVDALLPAAAPNSETP